ncbi:MAG: hypothetical protein ACE5HL_03170 [Terriglobia bacterium]
MAELNVVGYPNGEGQRFCLRVGGVPLKLQFPLGSLLEQARGRYAGFCEESSSGFPVSINSEAVPAPREVRFTHNLHGASLRLTPQAAYLTGVASEQTLDSLLRILLSLLLVPRRGLLLHAATIVRNQRANVFMGRSGAGKSTLARLAPPGSVLTDEVSLLRRGEIGWHAYATPFWGEFRAAGSNRRAPLAGIYVLVQGRENRREKLSPKQKLPVLLGNVLFFAQGKSDRDQLLALLLELIQAVPLDRLQFQPEPAFWEVVA